jgi:hypothetical protein
VAVRVRGDGSGERGGEEHETERQRSCHSKSVGEGWGGSQSRRSACCPLRLAKGDGLLGDARVVHTGIA